ncbi:MAG: YciI family protein [Actinobacteria bacterium]|nr:MAG: YciI family protein [Actinomycetota bacterium]
MQYLLLIYNDEQAWAALGPDERNAIVREYFALADELRADGAYVAAAPLQPTSTAQTVRVRDGERVVSDGPFAETKEQLGGFYLVEADSAQAALDWAEKIPGARYGAIEVRPLLPVPAEAPAA